MRVLIESSVVFTAAQKLLSSPSIFVFIKQHSVLDMFGAIILSACMYPFIYSYSYKRNTSKEDSNVSVDNEEHSVEHI